MAAQEDLVITGRLNTIGGLLDPGEVRTDEQGGLNIRDRVVWGTFQMSVDRTVITGKSSMSIQGRLDASDSGAVFGTFALIAEVRGARILVWEGHWAAQCVRRTLSGVMVGQGRERFAGRKLRVSMVEAGTTGGQQFRLEGAISLGQAIGVTGISAAIGGALSFEGKTEQDAAGKLHIRDLEAPGLLLLNFGGIEIRGMEHFIVNAILDADVTGPTYGSFTLTMFAGHDEGTIFEGHWAGHLDRSVGVSTMVGYGRGPFAGHKLLLHMEEIPAFEGTPDPNVYLLEGYAEEERGAGATGVSNSLGGVLEPGRTFTDERGRTNVRDMVVIGDLDLRVADVKITGKQIFKVNAVVDSRNNGIDYGSFLLNGDGGEPLWQGHWAGRSVERVGRSSEMFGLGKGRFAGQRIYLKMVEIAGFAGNPDPSIYILVGEVSAAIEPGVTGCARVAGGFAHLGGPSRDKVGRRLVQDRLAAGESWLLLGDAEVEGRQLLELDGALDDRQAGPLRGRFRLTEGTDAVLWEGEWSGRLQTATVEAAMVGSGRSRFAGREILLNAREPRDPPEILWGTPGGSLSGIRPQDAGDVEDLGVLLLNGCLTADKAGEQGP